MPKTSEDQYSFSRHISKVLRQVHPDTAIKANASNELNQLIHNLAVKIVCCSNQLVMNHHVKTTSSRDISSAVSIVIPGELGKHSLSEGSKAVTKFNSSSAGTVDHKSSRSTRAGLQFPVGRVSNIIRKHMTSERLTNTAPVYLSAVLEYITAEILELAGNGARDMKKIRINTRHILLAIKNDYELNKLFSKVTLSGGVTPNIQVQFLAKKNK